MGELDYGLTRLNILDVTWGCFDLEAFLQERARQAPAAGEAGDGTAETMNSPQGDAVDTSLTPIGRAETTETMRSSQGAPWMLPRSRQGGPKATRAHHQPPTPAKRTTRIPPRSSRRWQHTSSAAGNGSP